uniref:G_PROTEIN_RECEP_F1_2 domain-containing protein n=1 Tax=Elaeophora elaphi TaxID=1147741 RepID=A0A0R3RHX4_9BILA
MSNRELLLIIVFATYAFEGLLLIISNGLVELVLIKHRYLRRQYIILFAQAFADTVLGIGYCLAGIGRIIAMKLGPDRMTRRSCLLLPWSTVIIWSELMSATSTLMVSTDRIISLISPMRYFEKNYSYQVRQIIIYFASVSLFVFISWFFSFIDNESLLHGLCWSGDVLQPYFADIQALLMISTTSLSVILYIVVYFLSRKHLRRIKSNQTEASLQSFEARQRKLTITMGVSCVFTLIFYVIPLCSKLLIYDDDGDPTTYYSELMRVAVAISCNVNPLTNIAAVLIRQDDIAYRVKQILPECIQKSIFKCDQIAVPCMHTLSSQTIPTRKN